MQILLEQLIRFRCRYTRVALPVYEGGIQILMALPRLVDLFRLQYGSALYTYAIDYSTVSAFLKNQTRSIRASTAKEAGSVLLPTGAKHGCVVQTNLDNIGIANFGPTSFWGSWQKPKCRTKCRLTQDSQVEVDEVYKEVASEEEGSKPKINLINHLDDGFDAYANPFAQRGHTQEF